MEKSSRSWERGPICGSDVIRVDGKRVKVGSRFVYVLLNKPRNVMSTSSDPQDRPTVMEYVGNVKERIYPVGRLDFASEGLLILTNDGEFTKCDDQGGCHSQGLSRQGGGKARRALLEKLRRGMYLDGERLAPCEITPLKGGDNPWYEVTLHQGRNQQIRKMFGVSGHPVEKLRRVRIGFLEDSRLPAGAWRYLDEREVERFKREFKRP